MAYDLTTEPPLVTHDATVLRELRAVVERLRPEQLYESDWHTDGPVDPPTRDTVMSAASWYACSPEGQARGLSLDLAGGPFLEAESESGWGAMEQATELPSRLLEALFDYNHSPFEGLKDRGEDEDDQRQMMLDRLDHVLRHAPTGRVLSSR